jgi:CubicO group peptidase (beta-lactamase class C family)
VARLFGIFAAGGSELKLQPTTFAELVKRAVPPTRGRFDLVMHREASYSLGFMKPSRSQPFSPNLQSFAAAGIGGSFAFGDPVTQIGYAYVPNRCRIEAADPRERALRQAVYRCLQR